MSKAKKQEETDIQQKRRLAAEFHYYNNLGKHDLADIALEKLHVICQGDSDLMSRLLHGKSKFDMDEEERKEREEARRNQ